MKRSARARLVVGVVLTGAIALLGLTGCGRLGIGAGSSSGDTDTSDVSWDGQALQAIGFSTDDVTLAADDTPTPAPSHPAAKNGAAKNGARHRLLRFAFANGRTLHAEGVVQTDEGTKTVVIQRGQVTAVDANSVTVKSTDGFTLTWQAGSQLKVIVNRAASQLSSITVGETVGVAGTKDNGTTTARLLVVPAKK
jgi:hypothetical protein